jgi:predicted ATPase
MWRRIEVRNYRSIERVSVDLAPFTVVVGPNGSGKSNFADALVFARDIANDASSAVQNRGGIAVVSPGFAGGDRRSRRMSPLMFGWRRRRQGWIPTSRATASP